MLNSETNPVPVAQRTAARTQYIVSLLPPSKERGDSAYYGTFNDL